MGVTPSPTDTTPSFEGRDHGGGRDIQGMVLLAAEFVPWGRVVSYGDLAELVGCPARQVGRIMAVHGSETHWWRVVNHAGDLPQHLLAAAGDHWRREGITVKPSGRGCRIEQHRADLVALADAWEQAQSATGRSAAV